MIHADKLGPAGSMFTALCCLGVAPLLSALSAVGLGFLIHDWILIPLLALFLGVTVWALRKDRPRHGREGPVRLGWVAAVLILGGLFVGGVVVGVGLALLVGAAAWNGWLVRRSGPTQATARRVCTSIERKEEHGMGQRDLVVIGGGSAAFAAAIRGAELGARVAMVERGTIGGTCVNVGCVPSKALIRAAEIAWRRSHHPFEGVPNGDGRVDLNRVVRQKQELVERLRQAKYRDVLAVYPGIEYVEGEARFRDTRTIEVRGAGDTRELAAERVVLATGALPWAPPIAGLDRVAYWTSTEALASETLPESLLVVGGSAVGTELAQLFARLGCRVTILEALPTLVPTEDVDLGEGLARCLADEAIEIHVGAEVRSVEPAGERIRVQARVGGNERAFTGERLLVAAGRRPQLTALGLESAGVEIDGRGSIVIDEHLRTTQPNVFAAGDCAGLPQFVYVAARSGSLAAENALGVEQRPLDLSAVPAVTFTDPQVASVGRTEAEARADEESITVQVLSMEHVPRALVNRDTRGFLKIVARETDGRILGVHVLSSQAGEVIQTGALAVKLGLGIEDLADTLFPYLTEVEGLKLTAQAFSRQVEHLSCCAG